VALNDVDLNRQDVGGRHIHVNFTLEKAIKVQVGSTRSLTSALDGGGRPLYHRAKDPVPTIYTYV
jgi:hypothetical protein